MRRSYDHRRVSARREHDLSTDNDFLIFKKIVKVQTITDSKRLRRSLEHRRIILRTLDENAKISIVRSSQANRGTNVTYALIVVVIDVRMSWTLHVRPIDTLGRTEARIRLKSQSSFVESCREGFKAPCVEPDIWCKNVYARLQIQKNIC